MAAVHRPADVGPDRIFELALTIVSPHLPAYIKHSVGTMFDDSEPNMQHSTLVSLGVRWLNRHCSVVLYEFAAAGRENPDVIGWAAGADSIVIECKLTRSDFLRDAAKGARKIPKAGMGRRRYYLCPAGVIQLKDLPARWGLLWVEKGQVLVTREARGFPERNLGAEVRFLSAMLRRAQIRIGARPLSEWLRGENRLEAKRGIPPNIDRQRPNRSALAAIK
jgi:hypothetical protein